VEPHLAKDVSNVYRGCGLELSPALRRIYRTKIIANEGRGSNLRVLCTIFYVLFLAGGLLVGWFLIRRLFGHRTNGTRRIGLGARDPSRVGAASWLEQSDQ
jgi:hypothetical protein